MNYFISYDIAGDRERDRLARLLAERGCKRVQKSVFLAPGFAAAEIKTLQEEVVRKFSPALGPADSILLIPVENDWIAGLVWHGDNGLLRAALEQFPVKIL